MEKGGQKCERVKWKHCFEQVTVLVFTASLSDFNLTCFENTDNRSEDNLQTFENIINLNHFKTTPIILTFTKPDVFEKKFSPDLMRKYPLFEKFRGL